MAEPDFHSVLQFPYHAEPRCWLIVAGLSATGLRLARALLDHGDQVVLGVPTAAFEDVAAGNLEEPFPRRDSERLRQFLLEHVYVDGSGDEGGGGPGGGGEDDGPAAEEQQDQDQDQDQEEKSERHRRLRPVRLDARSMAHCQAAVAQAVHWFGGLDVLLCNSSEVVIGAVEELAASPEALALVRDQFEVNFFGSVNAIKAAVPAMRRKHNGHIMLITGITSHLGTPGLGAFCAAGWALEGYCDSIAYEVAPFNIRLTIVQPSLEVAVLPNKIKAAPQLPQYAPASHPAPLIRNVIGGLLDRIHDSPGTSSEPRDSRRRDSATTESTTSGNDEARPASKSLGSTAGIIVEEREVPEQMSDALIAETLFSICAIGGHPNPPQRHIVGTEGVVSVKEKLKTVSLELEDLVQASTAVDIVDDEGEAQA